IRPHEAGVHPIQPRAAEEPVVSVDDEEFVHLTALVTGDRALDERSAFGDAVSVMGPLEPSGHLGDRLKHGFAVRAGVVGPGRAQSDRPVGERLRHEAGWYPWGGHRGVRSSRSLSALRAGIRPRPSALTLSRLLCYPPSLRSHL